MSASSLRFLRACVYFLILLIGLVSFVLEKNFLNSTFYFRFYAVLILGLVVHLFAELVFTKKISFTLPSKLALGLGLFDVALAGVMMYLLKGPTLFFTMIFLVFILISSLESGLRGGLFVSFVAAAAYGLASAFDLEAKNINYILNIVLHSSVFIGFSSVAGVVREQYFEAREQAKSVGLSLRALQELNRIIMQNLPVGVISFTEQGEVLSLNPFAEKIFKVNRVSNEGERSLKDYGVDLARLSEEKKTEIQGPNSKVLSFSHGVYRNDSEKINLHIAVVEDLTDVRRLEGIARQNEKLAAIGGLAAGIAHEIRNPLASISGSVEMLSQTTQNEDDQRLMKIVLKEIQRLNNLISEFLDYARPEKPYADSVNLTNLLEEVFEYIRQDKNLTQGIEVIKNFDAKVMMIGNAEKLRQVFINLIVNACQALSGRKSATITCKLMVVADQAQVVFQDNGIGMKPEVQKRIFEPFYTTKSKGTGLGLAITHKIIQTHRGVISVQSEEGQGTVFTLTFPIQSQ